MAIYLLFGKYSAESLKGISAKRSEEARALIKSTAASSRPPMRRSAASIS